MRFAFLLCIALARGAPAQDSVDLSGQEIAAIRSDSTAHVLARPWYENFDLSGYGAADYIATGANGTRPDGGFLIRSAALFVRANAWKNADIYMEILASPPVRTNPGMVRTSEVYAQFRDLVGRPGENRLGVRVGRIALPFGLEYDRVRLGENALVLSSAPYPWGVDEGLLLYGDLSGVRWMTSVTDGADERGQDDDPNKSFNFRFDGTVHGSLDLSASLMGSGRTARSALTFAGSNFVPVGKGLRSSLGVSPSGKVSARLYEIDARWNLGKFGEIGSLSAFFGQAFEDDSQAEFDRNLTWFSVEPLVQITRTTYVAARFSEIGTYDPEAGYVFEGGMTAGGSERFGFDTRRLRRMELGLGWRPNVKAEVAQDRFDTIRDSKAASGSDGLHF